MKLSSLISGPAAVIVFLAFFMPWITVECSGQEIGTSSVYEIATGSSDVEDTTEYNDPELDESDSYLWLIPMVSFGVGIVALLRYGSVLSSSLTAGLYGIGALVALIALMAEYMDIQDAVDKAEEEVGSGVLSVTYEYGWWLSVLGLLAIFAAAFMAYSEKDSPRTVYRPAPPGQPPSGPYF